MRILIVLAAACGLGLAACARDDSRAEAEPDASQEFAEAGEAVGDAAVEVGEAARVAVTAAAEEVDENAAEPRRAEPAREVPRRPRPS